MRPAVPDEIADKGFEREGMMFVGDKGRIVADYHCSNPRLIPDSKMDSYMHGQAIPKGTFERGADIWIDPFRNKTQSPGSFLLAGSITETILLGAVALRAGRRVDYDSQNMKTTNFPEANKYLVREYRKGWEL